MISFKSFVSAIHEAIMNASDSLMQKNQGFLDTYFTEVNTVEKDENGADITKSSLTPKIVTLDYPSPNAPPKRTPLIKSSISPFLTANPGVSDPGLLSSAQTEEGDNDNSDMQIQVPLITLVPLSMPQIEKTVLTADFEIQIVDGEVQLNFTNGTASSNTKGFFKKSKTTRGKLEITISPQEPSEGLKQIVESYEAILKRQIP